MITVPSSKKSTTEIHVRSFIALIVLFQITENGKLRGKVKIGIDDDGKPIYKYVSAETPKELEFVKQAAREHFVYGREIPRDMNFAEFAENWYLLRKEPFISQASKASYKVCFMKHLLPEFGLQQMRAIGANQIQSFINGYAGSSRSQITMQVGTLKAIFSTAYAEGMIERDPTVSLIRPKAAKVREAFGLQGRSTVQGSASFRSCRRSVGIPWEPPPFRSMILLMLPICLSDVRSDQNQPPMDSMLSISTPKKIMFVSSFLFLCSMLALSLATVFSRTSIVSFCLSHYTMRGEK